MFTWYPKTLKCQIYDDNKLIDLNKCSDTILENLADSIFVHWKTPINSAIWFDVEIYEKHYWFQPPKNYIEIVCFKLDVNSLSRRKQIDISKLYMDKMFGKRFKITPEDTIYRKWSNNVEVMFVA
jgi:hypothetical protein